MNNPLALTSEQALYALHSMLGEHTLVDSIVTRFANWEELAGADAATRAFKIGAWAAQLSIPQLCPPLPSFGAGVSLTSRYSRLYPQRLTDISDAPVLLYQRNRFPDGPYIAIGGSFWPSRFGTDVTQAAARAAVKAKRPVVAVLDGGSGELAIKTALEAGGKVLAVGYGDLSAPSQHTETVGRVLEQGGSIVSEWGVGEAWTESRAFAATRLVAALGTAVVLTELGTHPAGGAHFARASVATGRFMIVPEPPAEELIGAAQTGLAVFGRARSFSPRVFGAHPRMLSRVAAGYPAADAVVNSEDDMIEAFKKAMRS